MKTLKLPSPAFSVIAGSDPQSMVRVALDAGSMSGMTNQGMRPMTTPVAAH